MNLIGEMLMAFASVKTFGQRKICFENNNTLREEYFEIVKELAGNDRDARIRL
ncbi:MAG: hypothetical protein OIN88_05315 [Candidatus Methanoperedens sp.]|nr:hypothetical protein [Candidatus Methanoperedens sp.]